MGRAGRMGQAGRMGRVDRMVGVGSHAPWRLIFDATWQSILELRCHLAVGYGTKEDDWS